MAKSSIGPRISVEGEEEYRKQIMQIIEQAKTLDAQMGALTASFTKNMTEEEKAAKQTGLLAKQIETAEKRVDLLREMVQKSIAAKGEDAAETLKWKQALYGAEEQLNKLNNQNTELTGSLDKVGDAIEQAEKKTGGFGDQLDNLAGKLGVKIPDAAKQALNGIDGFSAGTVAKLGVTAAAVAGVIKAVQKLNDITEQAAERADDLLTKSQQTGLSTTQLQQMRFASPFIDVDESTITGAISRLPRFLAQAQEQMQKYAEAQQKAAESGKPLTAELGAQASALQRLGVSATDSSGQLRDVNEVNWEILEALGQIGNQTEADAIANDIFGKSYAELKPLINNVDEAQRLYNEAISEGYVLSEEQLAILGEVDDAHQKLKLTQEATTNQIALQWAPANKAAYENLAKLTKMAGDSLDKSGLVDNLASIVESTLDIVSTGSDLIGALPSWMNPIDQISEALRGVAVILATIADAADVVAGIFTLDWSRIKTGLGFGSEMSNLEKLMRSGPDFVSYNAAGTRNWSGGLTWVGESGPELVRLPQGSRIYSNQESSQIASGGDTWNVTIDAKNVQEFNDIVRLAKSARIRGRMK